MNEKFIQNLDKLPADVRRQFALLANQKTNYQYATEAY